MEIDIRILRGQLDQVKHDIDLGSKYHDGEFEPHETGYFVNMMLLRIETALRNAPYHYFIL